MAAPTPHLRRTYGPDGYARRTLVNALIDERRRPFWRRESPRAVLPDRAALARDSEHGQLRAALAELPAGMRAVVVFRYVHINANAEAGRG